MTQEINYTIAGETIVVCLSKAYEASLSATVRYRNMDSFLQSRNIQINGAYNFLSKQYAREGVAKEVADKHIGLYQDHLSRMFKGDWKKVVQKKVRKNGKIVKTSKSVGNKVLTEERVIALLKKDENIQMFVKVLKDLGYTVSK